MSTTPPGARATAARSWSQALLALTIVLGLIATGYLWWTRHERAIRKQMASIADALTTTTNQGDLAPVRRVARLRTALAPEIGISVSPPAAAAPGAAGLRTREVVGRDAVLAIVSRWVPPPDGVVVEFTDLEVVLHDSAEEAEVTCTARITSHVDGGQPTVDIQPLTVGFRRIESEWVVASVHASDAPLP